MSSKQQECKCWITRQKDELTLKTSVNLISSPLLVLPLLLQVQSLLLLQSSHAHRLEHFLGQNWCQGSNHTDGKVHEIMGPEPSGEGDTAKLTEEGLAVDDWGGG